MNDLNFKKRDYLEAKGNADHFSEALQEKRSEVVELENELAEAKNDLQQLYIRLNTAHRDMAIGRLSTDQFMELKREIGEKESAIALLNEAFAAQKGAIELINADRYANRREQNEFLKRNAADLSGQFADEVAALAADQIRNLTYALVAARGKNRAFTNQERQRDREAVYLAIGEALCRRAFPNETASLDFIPDLLQAKQHIGDLIEQRD
jgi:chromosome segregation ATPase